MKGTFKKLLILVGFFMLGIVFMNYYPNKVEAVSITQTTLAQLQEGDTYTFNNKTSITNKITVDNGKFDYVTYNSDGSIYEQRIQYQGLYVISVPSGGYIVITATNVNNGGLNVTENGDFFSATQNSSSAFNKVYAKAGDTYEFDNNDNVSRQITTSSNISFTTYGTINYVTYDVNGNVVDQKIHQSVGNLTVPAKGKAVITAVTTTNGVASLEFDAPSKASITAKASTVPALNVYTAKAGDTYEFDNNDNVSRQITTSSNISFTTYGTINYVIYDVNGNIVDEKIHQSVGNLTVPANGKAVITAVTTTNGVASLEFDAPSKASITAKASTVPALNVYTAKAGDTYEFDNNDNVSRQITTSSNISFTTYGTINYVTYDVNGNVVDQKANQSVGSVTVPANGKAVITAVTTTNGVASLEFDTPGLTGIAAKTSTVPALNVYTAKVGDTYEFDNNDNVSRQITTNSNLGINYTTYGTINYVTYDVNGNVVEQRIHQSIGNLTVPAKGKAVITAVTTASGVASLEFDTPGLTGIAAKTSTMPALNVYTAKVGDTYEFDNNDNVSRQITTNSNLSINYTNYGTINYVTYDVNGNVVDQKIHQSVGNVTVPAKGKAVITAVTTASGIASLEFDAPGLTGITAKTSTVPALNVYTAKIGDTYEFDNNDNVSRQITTNSNLGINYTTYGTINYVTYDVNGNVVEQRIHQSIGNLTVPAKGKAVITAVTTASGVASLEFDAPGLTGITAKTSTVPALNVYTAKVGDTYEFDNNDNVSRQITTSSNISFTTYGTINYVTYDVNGNVVDQKIHQSVGSLTVPAKGKAVITAVTTAVTTANGVASLEFDTPGLTGITAKTSTVPALNVYTAKIGDTYEFDNNDNVSRQITTSSNISFTTYGTINYVTYDVNGNVVDQKIHQSIGNLTVPANGKAVITAVTTTNGVASLEFDSPGLTGITAKTSAVPALNVYTAKVGDTYEFDNNDNVSRQITTSSNISFTTYGTINYVTYDVNGNIVDQKIHQSVGSVTVPANGKAVITAVTTTNGVANLEFDSPGLTGITAKTSTVPALNVYTAKVGDTYEFDNNDNVSRQITTSSNISFTTYGTINYVTYDVNGNVVDQKANQSVGSVTVPANGKAVITAVTTSGVASLEFDVPGQLSKVMAVIKK